MLWNFTKSCVLVWKIMSLKAELPTEFGSLGQHACINLHQDHCIHADSMYRGKHLAVSFHDHAWSWSCLNIYMLKHIFLCYYHVIFIFIYQLMFCEVCYFLKWGLLSYIKYFNILFQIKILSNKIVQSNKEDIIKHLLYNRVF